MVPQGYAPASPRLNVDPSNPPRGPKENVVITELRDPPMTIVQSSQAAAGDRMR
jgi:hypothetical protein